MNTTQARTDKKTAPYTRLASLVVCSVCFGLSHPRPSHGQIVLSGLLQQGTSANAQTVGSPIMNTLGNELAYANLYVTRPNGGYNAPFLNHGNGDGVTIFVLPHPRDVRILLFE